MEGALDPRVRRLPELNQVLPKAPLDQFGTYEVFVQAKEGKPFTHEGCVHAPNVEMAFVLAKETFTRRFTCVSLFVVETRRVFVSAMMEGTDSAYNLFTASTSAAGQEETFEVFHLYKRGKQHQQHCTISAIDPVDAIVKAGNSYPSKLPVLNIWVIRTADIRFTREDERDLWNTLPEKKFRDAAAYKAGDKLKEFTERSS